MGRCRLILVLAALLLTLPVMSSCINRETEISEDRPRYAYEDTMWVCKDINAWIHYSDSYYSNNYGEITVENLVIPLCEETRFSTVKLVTDRNAYDTIEEDYRLVDSEIIFESNHDYSEDHITYDLDYKNSRFISNDCDELTFIKLHDLDYEHDYVDRNKIVKLDLDSARHFVINISGDSLKGIVALKGEKVILTTHDMQVFTFIRDLDELVYDKFNSNNKYNLDKLIISTWI